MDTKTALRELQHEWKYGTGFFWKLRLGELDLAAARRLEAILEQLPRPEGPTIDRELVAEIWSLPLSIEWHRDRVRERHGVDVEQREFSKLLTRVNGLVEQILRTPGWRLAEQDAPTASDAAS